MCSEYLRRICLNRSNRNSIYNTEYERIETNYPIYFPLIMARSTRYLFVLILFLLVLMSDLGDIIGTQENPEEINYAAIFRTVLAVSIVKFLIDLVQFIVMLFAWHLWNKYEDFGESVKCGYFAMFIEFLNLFTILIPYYDIAESDGLDLFLSSIEKMIPYLILLYSTKNILNNLAGYKEVYGRIYHLMIFLFVPFYVFLSGITINITSSLFNMANNAKNPDIDYNGYKIAIYAMIYFMLLLFLYGIYAYKSKLNNYFELLWFILFMIIINWYGLFGTLLTKLLTASVRIFKFKILIQDFIIYSVEFRNNNAVDSSEIELRD